MVGLRMISIGDPNVYKKILENKVVNNNNNK